jgi:hypothetical protein
LRTGAMVALALGAYFSTRMQRGRCAVRSRMDLGLRRPAIGTEVA